MKRFSVCKYCKKEINYCPKCTREYRSDLMKHKNNHRDNHHKKNSNDFYYNYWFHFGRED